jgi:hypothetical protein
MVSKSQQTKRVPILVRVTPEMAQMLEERQAEIAKQTGATLRIPEVIRSVLEQYFKGKARKAVRA